MKVLIISHNPISSSGNMGITMNTLFSAFNSDELCQLYIYPTVPDLKKCNSYYRVTDKDILKSFLKLRVEGKEILKEEIDETKHQIFENIEDETLYRNKRNKTPFRMLMRDIMWKLSCWFNKDLKCWLKKEKPTCIFVAPGNFKFIYDIALKISKYCKIPIVSYICDDYYFVKRPLSLLGKLQVKLIKKRIAKLMSNTKKVITICDELNHCYSTEFNVACTTVMTGSKYPINNTIKKPVEISTLTYMGNIRVNRYLSLKKIGLALDDINREFNKDYKLHIYTGEKDRDILNEFKNIKSIVLCGFVSGIEYEKVFKSSEVLVHVEDFNEQSIDFVKFSMSTKIADCLGSGILLFAFAPSNVASMKYLINNNCAICCYEENDLKNTLLNLLLSNDTNQNIINNALDVAKKNHQCDVVGDKVKEVFKDVLNEGFTN